MKAPLFKTITEQVAAHLREEILSGQWNDGMPGQKRLSKALGVSGQTVELALQQLEKEGLLLGQGSGRCRQVEQSQTKKQKKALRVMIMLYEESDRKVEYLVTIFHLLRDAGHEAEFASKTLWDLGMNLKRIAHYVETKEADAWLVLAGSKDVLEWFSQRKTPAFAIFGRLNTVSIAGTGPKKSEAMAAAVRRLTELGHRRIVMLAREERRKPLPGRVERAFLEELEKQGIATSTYNLPDWEDSPMGLHICLSSLFKFTAPTAMVISTLEIYAAVQQFLTHRGIRVPQDISLICSVPQPENAWRIPSLSHITYDETIFGRYIVHWLKNVTQGKDDRRQIFTESKFFEGGSIGPVPRSQKE